MEINISIFELAVLKKQFYYFFAGTLAILLLALVIPGVLHFPHTNLFAKYKISWVVFPALLLVAFLQTSAIKKNLAALKRAPDTEGLFERYTAYYKRKLWLNGISVLTTAACYLCTHSKMFFYILITLVLFSFVFYPRKKQIQQELPDSDIEFT